MIGIRKAGGDGGLFCVPWMDRENGGDRTDPEGMDFVDKIVI